MKPIAYVHWIENGEEYSMDFYHAEGKEGYKAFVEELKKEGHVCWTCITNGHRAS